MMEQECAYFADTLDVLGEIADTFKTSFASPVAKEKSKRS